MQPQWAIPEWIQHSQDLLDSYRRLIGRDLIARTGHALHDSRTLFNAPFVVVSHGVQPDPIFNYGNLAALKLWQIDIVTLLQMPSRLTAEAMHRDERAKLLARTDRDGFVDDYRGIRISSTGQRFLIERAIVWNVSDISGRRLGQAATFSQWTPLAASHRFDSNP